MFDSLHLWRRSNRWRQACIISHISGRTRLAVNCRGSSARVGGVTDEWAKLMEALQNVRDFAKEEITSEELQTVNQLITVVDKIVHRR
jgi:hypothetical protein